MDARIILAGEQPNFVNVLAQSSQAAQQQNDIQAKNALAGYARDNGAAIMSGDKNALAGLAGQGIDGLNSALSIQQTQRGNAIEDQKLGLLMAQEKRAVETHAATLSKAEREQAAAEIERVVKMGLMIPDAATWDAQMAKTKPEFVGQFANRQALAAGYMDMADALKLTQGPEYRPATAEEAATYGAAGGQLNTRTGKFDPINPPSGLSVKTNPDGTMSLTQGPGAGMKPLTEGQAKDNVFATRAEGAIQQLEPVASNLTSRGEKLAEAIPLGFGREMQSEGYQVAKQAGDEFLQAILRKDTGAAITAVEQELYGQTYLPQPGDGPAVLEAKKASRARALEALRSGMSIEQVTMTEQALIKAAERSGVSGPVSIRGYQIEALD